MKTAHTPTPWEWGDTGSIFARRPGKTSLHLANYFMPGNEENTDQAEYEIAEANAEFIVRAVNSYDAMVDALEYIENNIMPDDEGNREITPRHMKRIRAALAAARGDD